MVDDVESRKKHKLKRIARKKPKLQLNSSINTKVFAKNLTMHNKNTMMNTSVVKATLRANNKALAQSLEKVRLDLRTANEIIMMEKKEKQELQHRVSTLNRVAGLQDEQFEVETNRRIEAKLHHLKSLLHQTSTHLFDAGMCIQQAMEKCFSSRLSQVSEPRSSSVGFTTADEDTSPAFSQKKRTFIYQPSSMNCSPPSKEDVENTAEKLLFTVEDGCSSLVEMSMIMEQSMLAGSSHHALGDGLPAVLESAIDDTEAVKLAKKKRDFGTPQRVLTVDQTNKTATSSVMDVLDTDVENVVKCDTDVPKETIVHEEMSRGEEKPVENEEAMFQENKQTDQELNVEDQFKLSENQNLQKLRRGTFVFTSPKSCIDVDNEKQKRAKNIDRRGTFILPASNKNTTNELSSKADSVESNKKRETFCIPEILTHISEVKILDGDNSGITKLCPPPPPQDDQSVFKHPSILTDPCSVESCSDQNNDHTMYFNSDMEMTAVVDVTSLIQPNTEENNRAEKKTKPAVSLRLSKPGKITFTAARKEDDGTRKVIPSKLPSKIRSKTKKQLRQLQEAIASDKSKPNNIFDFHDKTPSHLQDKPSVFDVSLNESSNGTKSSVDEYQERLQKLKANMDNKKATNQAEAKETNINGNTKDSKSSSEVKTGNDGEIKSKETVKKSRTKNKAQKETSKDLGQVESDSSASRNSTEKCSLMDTNDVEVDRDKLKEHDIISSKSKTRSKKKDRSKENDVGMEHVPVTGCEQTYNSASVTPSKQKSTKSKTTSLVHENASHPDVKDSTSKKSSQKLPSKEVSNIDKTFVLEEDGEVACSSKPKSILNEKPNQKSQMKTGLDTPTKNVERNVNLLPDTCIVYRLPLKGSPVSKSKSRRSKSQGPSRSASKSRKKNTESSQITDIVARPTRSRSCKRVDPTDYTKINSDDENNSESSTILRSPQSPEKKLKARSRGRSLKRRSLTQTRSVSRKRANDCDVESLQSEFTSEIVTATGLEESVKLSTSTNLGITSSLSGIVTESSPTCKQATNKDVEKNVKLLPDTCSVYSLPLKGSPVKNSKNKRSKSHGPSSRSASKSRKKNTESSQITDIVTRPTRSRSCKRADIIDYTEIDSDDENENSTSSTVLRSPQSPENKPKARSHGRPMKRRSLTQTRSLSKTRRNAGEDESSQSELSLNMVNAASCEQNTESTINPKPVTDTEFDCADKQPCPEEVERSTKLIPDICPVYSLPLKGSPDIKTSTSVANRRSRSRGPASSKSKKEVEQSSQIKDAKKKRKRIIPFDDTESDCDDDKEKDSESVITVESPERTEKKSRPRGRSLKRSLTRTLSGSSKKVSGGLEGTEKDKLLLETDVASSCENTDESNTECEGNKITDLVRPSPKAYLIKKKHPNMSNKKIDSLSGENAIKTNSPKNHKIVKSQNCNANILKKSVHKNIPNHVLDPTTKESTKLVAKLTDKSTDKTSQRSAKNFLAMFEKASKESNSNAVSSTSSDSPTEKTEKKVVKNTSVQKVKSKSVKKNVQSLKTAKQATDSPSRFLKQQVHRDLFKWTPDCSPKKVELTLQSKSCRASSTFMEDDHRQSSSLEILKRKLALLPDTDHQSEENYDENNEMNWKRSRRAATGISYKVPSLSVKMRRGDPGTSTLYGEGSIQIFKSKTKTGSAEQNKPLANVTNWKMS